MKELSDRLEIESKVPRCIACGSVNIEICQLLGHIYPIKEDRSEESRYESN